LIKCNPAIKSHEHRVGLWQALLRNRLDVIATDHAPHTWDEKHSLTNGKPDYFKTPSGIPLIQHSLQIMLNAWKEGKITLESIVEKMCHAPAICFGVNKRGYIREGYWADLVLVDVTQSQLIEKSNIRYQCCWSPFEHTELPGTIVSTFVNGHLVYHKGVFDESIAGMRLDFAHQQS
jgi:dihydroorotase